MKCVFFVSIKNLIFSILGNQPLAHLFSDQASTKSGYRHLSNPEISYLSTGYIIPFPHILKYAKKREVDIQHYLKTLLRIFQAIEYMHHEMTAISISYRS